MLTTLRRHLFSKSWLVDLPLIALAWWLAFWLRFNLSIPDSYLGLAARTTPLALLGMALGLALRRVPRQSWRYVSLSELRQLTVGVALGAVLTTAVAMGLRIDDFPRSVLPISAVLALVLLAGARAAWRTLMELARSRAQTHSGAAPPLPLLIAGTLEEADHALRTLKGAAGWRAAGIVSPRAQDQGRTVQGVQVLGLPAALAGERHSFGVASIASAATRWGAWGGRIDDALYLLDRALTPLTRQHAVYLSVYAASENAGNG